jgi:pimeloyl-ACP methyl ester carboxylesterase
MVATQQGRPNEMVDLVSAYYGVLAAVLAGIAILVIVPTDVFVRAVGRTPLVSAIVVFAAWLGGLYAYGVWRDSGASVALRTVRPSGAPGRTLVLVHGWQGNEETWSSLLPLLMADSRFGGYGIAKIDYPTSRIFDQGRSLRLVGSEVASAMSKGLEGQRISFVTHSTGGVLARQAIVELSAQGWGGDIERLVTFSAPHGGTDVAKFAGLIGLSQALLADLQEGSGYLLRLREQWSGRRGSKKATQLIETCLSSTADSVVTPRSASAGCQHHDDAGPWAHGEIHRPQSMTDARYEKLVAGLLRDLPPVPAP